ncbi:alpha,alpha-phosphotrehalase [Salibacterium salarium]|uniref:Alpha,alpha-phosphotrehalase n=1 Tax=Salibacterium salarium TaxID=284579 RepID=A0A3R9P1D5_9BACI|nr:alpha,alpha-phosphotrehalase [Salibacterium salarium]RSL30710.1 alpha,alpha-phosphotrehalase [Salibacterium salarium]
MQEWWRKAVVYQIYPKSFNDTTGNGMGDIKGIMNKLDYIRMLGTDVIWLTPIYASPQRDNGYDISDYFSIHPPFGSMEDFDELLNEAHKRNLKIIMDIVVNHTSTDHAWFQEAKCSINNPYRNYYIWKDPVNGREPNNWQSKFGGSAWEFDSHTGQYYLHLFDKTQADLNWENPELRQKLYDMMDFWFQKGVDGFRLDVINLISKNQDFPDDDGLVSPGDGRKFYTDGPRVHEFIHEMNTQVFSKHDSMTVGEMSSTTIDDCIKYTRPDRNELDMTFNFHHLKVDYPNGEKWALADFDFMELKKVLSTWQREMHEGGGWNALFWCNHDQPRIVSRFGDDGEYHSTSAKMLATALHFLQGTPYIYQGEEFGMTNPAFETIDDYRDVETLNYYDHLSETGKSDQKIMGIIQEKSRDNSRTPMQWNQSKNAGFTDAPQPWIPVAPNYHVVNAETALNDENSIFYHYKKLIELRKTYDIITIGDYELLLEEHPQLFCYVRNREKEHILVINNFYKQETIFSLPASHAFLADKQANRLLSNYKDTANSIEEIQLRPYESVAYLLR